MHRVRHAAAAAIVATPSLLSIVTPSPAQAAQARLTDARRKAMAANIIRDQQHEIEQLRGYRDMFYGDPRPMPMGQHLMAMMMQMLPGMGDMTAMQLLMDPQALVAAFCSGEDPDLTFIDLAIPLHEMAIQASEAALDKATHEEIRAIAQRVIEAQQREVDELQAIRAELGGQGTPVNS